MNGDTRQEMAAERGVTRDRIAPNGYHCYSGVAEDGTLASHHEVREEADTDPADHQFVIDSVWREIRAYEAHLTTATLSAASAIHLVT